MQEKWKPLYEIEDNGIYHKRDKFLLVSKKEFTLQDEKTIFKRKRMNREFEPKNEVKIPICGGCGKIVDITDFTNGYIKKGDDYFHLDHFQLRDKTLGKHGKN